MMGMGNNDEMNADEEARLLKERARSVALISREARSNQRRYASVLGDDFNELFKFSQLKLRKKHLRFARYVPTWFDQAAGKSSEFVLGAIESFDWYYVCA